MPVSECLGKGQTDVPLKLTAGEGSYCQIYTASQASSSLTCSSVLGSQEHKW